MARKIIRLLAEYGFYSEFSEDLKVFLNGAAAAYGLVPLSSLTDCFYREFGYDSSLWQMTLGGLLLETESDSEFRIMTEADMWSPDDDDQPLNEETCYLVHTLLLKDRQTSLLDNLWERDLSVVKPLSKAEYRAYAAGFVPIESEAKNKLLRYLKKNSKRNHVECVEFLNQLQQEYLTGAFFLPLIANKNDTSEYFSRFLLKSDSYMLGLRPLLTNWYGTLPSWINRGYTGAETTSNSCPADKTISLSFGK